MNRLVSQIDKLENKIPEWGITLSLVVAFVITFGAGYFFAVFQILFDYRDFCQAAAEFVK